MRRLRSRGGKGAVWEVFDRYDDILNSKGKTNMGEASERPSVPRLAEVQNYLRVNRNWGRWGADDERGTANLITDECRVRAAQLIRSGRSISLSRPIDVVPGVDNTQPVQHHITVGNRPHGAGYAGDYFGISCHGHTTTHIDALCHIWDDDGIYNDRSPDQVIGFGGANFGGAQAWADGITGRGVLIDVPRHRGTSYVTQDNPVHGWELDEIVKQHHVELEPGDIVCVYSGREAFERDHPDQPYGRWKNVDGEIEKPGLHASCLWFLRQHDVGALVWDMMDLMPHGYDVAWTVHGSIHSFGLILIDNALLETLAEICASENRDTFFFTCAPMLMERSTGSIANPVAIL